MARWRSRRLPAAIRLPDLLQPWLPCLSSAAKARPVEHRSATLLRVWPLSSDGREPPRPNCLPARTGCGSTDCSPTDAPGGCARRVPSVVRLGCEPPATARLRLGEQITPPGQDDLAARLRRRRTWDRHPASAPFGSQGRRASCGPCDARVGGSASRWSVPAQNHRHAVVPIPGPERGCARLTGTVTGLAKQPLRGDHRKPNLGRTLPDVDSDACASGRQRCSARSVLRCKAQRLFHGLLEEVAVHLGHVTLVDVHLVLADDCRAGARAEPRCRVDVATTD